MHELYLRESVGLPIDRNTEAISGNQNNNPSSYCSGWPEVAEKKLPRSGPSLHDMEKDFGQSCRGKADRRYISRAERRYEDVTNADTSTDGAADYRRPGREICEWIWLPSGRAERNEWRRNFAVLGDSGTRLGFPANDLEMTLKFLQISEPSLDATSALCPLTG